MENSVYIMATPEKALCDLIANQPGVNLRYKGSLRVFGGKPKI